VDVGHTVLLIEHHLDVIKTADYVMHGGGEVVVTGTPEEVAGRARRRLRDDFSSNTCEITTDSVLKSRPSGW
jgi:excinuclease UvrABC ATPase subunit